MHPKPSALIALLLCVSAVTGCTPERNITALEEEVRATETAFARTMAERDFTGFQKFLASDAVFFSGPKPLRGEAAVAAYWQQYFSGEQAPFSWQPETVQVLETGQLALSTGPVTTADGKSAGTFTSIWRRESAGRWRIVFDKDGDACPCAASPP